MPAEGVDVPEPPVDDDGGTGTDDLATRVKGRVVEESIPASAQLITWRHFGRKQTAVRVHGVRPERPARELMFDPRLRHLHIEIGNWPVASDRDRLVVARSTQSALVVDND